MTVPLAGKVVLITGASSGFGLDAARLFAAEGAKVALAARRLERMQVEIESIRAAGGEAAAFQVDVTALDDIEQMVRAVIEKYGRIDILFNNAGVGRLGWYETLDPQADVHAQINVNLLGLMDVTRSVLPTMLAQGSGHIINMSSVAGWIAAPMYAVYSASKYGVRGFTNGLRRDMRLRGIAVSGIYPGFAKTEFGQHIGSNVLKRDFRMPDWTYMTSEYVAGQVVRLAQHPRRELIIPWWFRPAIWFEQNFPGAVDFIVEHFFVKKYRNSQNP